MNLLSSNLSFYPHSLTLQDGVEYGLVRLNGAVPQLAVLSAHPAQPGGLPDDFEGERSELDGRMLLLGPAAGRNAAALRARLDWLRPRLLDRCTSAGMGDRIGLATPGHVRAVRACGGPAPIFAQQSMREMARTGRSPRQVLDDATWGVFQEGWRGGMGADADHLKTSADIDACLEAGFTFFTFDPGAHVDPRAETASAGALRELAAALPVEVGLPANGLAGKTIEIQALRLCFDEQTLSRAAVKYGRAVAHVAALYHHLAAQAAGRAFEVEVSVDETEQPTSHAEHYYISSELQRLGVQWVSLAPRYVGRFEKGVDYIGSLEAFDANFAGHAAIARSFGGYKLSLHSGSDKFRIYPIAARHARRAVHLKTAGTSYLEALRAVATVDGDLFREICRFARQRYPIDRASYHVSADADQMGAGLALEKDGLPQDRDLPRLLDDFHAREVLHVTYGSVLTEPSTDGAPRFYERLMRALREHPDVYAGYVESHFIRHLKPFLE